MNVLAYIDPGLGLLAWQAVVAFFVGLLFYLKKTRTWLLGLFRKPVQASRRPGVAEAAVRPGERRMPP